MKSYEKIRNVRSLAVNAAGLCLALTALAAESPKSGSPPRLAGIVSLPDQSCAVLELAKSGHLSARQIVLSERQREEDVEVEKIEPEKGSVKLVWEGAGGTEVRLNNTTNLPVPGIVLEDVGLNAVLELLGQFTNRSLLRWPHLPASSFNLRASAKDNRGAVRVVAEALVAHGLSIIPDGEKFLMIVPKSEAARVNPHAPRPEASRESGTETQTVTPGSGSKEEELILPGMIDFRGADTRQVVEIYSSMVGRTFDRGGPPINNGFISFYTQTRLTKEEAIYALETMLRWNGIKLVPEGKDKLKATRVQED
jgi:hypothetical protein